MPLQVRNSFILFLCAVIWGSAFVAQALGMNHIGPFAFTFARSIIGGLFLLAVLPILDRITRKKIDETTGEKSNPWRNPKVWTGGILCGIVTIPLGVLAGGLTAGFPLPMVLRNLVPIVLIALLIAIGLWRAENAMVRGFEGFGKLVVAVATVGLAAAIGEALTGYPIIRGMEPISEGFETVGVIAIVLAGAFPLVFVLTKLLRKPLLAAGGLLGINDAAAAGLLASLANSIAAFGMVKDMNERGKVVNIAFAVSGAFVFGDHLGFTAGFAPEMMGAMIVGKLVGGLTAIAAAWILTRKSEKA